MNRQEFEEKWGDTVNRCRLDEKKHQEFVNDCFEMYEQEGFLEVLDSTYEELGKNGMKFKVIRRATNQECDPETMPVWLVRFENGETAYCYPEEICRIEKH